MKLLTVLLSCMAGLALAAAPLDPVVVKKKVKVVRRPIMVSVIGLNLQEMPPDGELSVEEMIRYWTDGMDREISNRPDLIVLPEICDVWRGMDPERKNRWLDRRGDRILKAFQAYAKKYHTYLIYPTYRDLPGGRRSNCSILIDREGDVIAIYDKVYPTVRDLGNRVLPGREPVVVETDFGTLGFAICFDLNFWDLLDKYAKIKPDVIAFSSYYHGDFMLQLWAYKCRSHLIASTIGNLTKNVLTPCGTFQRTERHYCFWTFSEKLNTNCRVVHLDFNWDKIQAASSKYGRLFRMDSAGSVGAVTLYSEDPTLPIDDVIREFGIETWDEYYARSLAACAETRKTAPVRFAARPDEAARLDPEVVKKPVKIVRRPVMVSVIGEHLLRLKEGETPTVEVMIEHWTQAMDREIAKRPDLIVLPELCDMWSGLPDAEAKHRWIARRGDKILLAFRAYAKKHRCYLVYPAYRQLGGRRYQNSAFLIDREGDVAARYDKVCPTVRDIAFGTIPGSEPVVADTDFGKLGLVICFDLNFWELLDRYAALRPDIIAFSSYYHGDFMLRAWAYKCQAHLVASTIGGLPKNILTPCGTFQKTERDYFRLFTAEVNTNCRVVHLDFNWPKIQAARNKYGRDLRIDSAGSVGAVTLYSENPSLPIDGIVKEFGIETWDEYYARSRKAGQDALRSTTSPAGKPAPVPRKR